LPSEARSANAGGAIVSATAALSNRPFIFIVSLLEHLTDIGLAKQAICQKVFFLTWREAIKPPAIYREVFRMFFMKASVGQNYKKITVINLQHDASK
tara:strand:+ start:1594 stop:1884 length:291 start_codon:yes stop_codon:yes gene_type:complete